MPLLVVSGANKEAIDMFVNVEQVGIAHGFECLWWDTGESGHFSIL
jgi:hypothetical protein